MRRAAKTIAIENLKSPDRIRFGVRHEGRVAVGHHADVTPGHTIRLHGIETNRHGGPLAYDRTFRIGDTAAYDSYNLEYLGTIVAIGAKLVTIAEDGSGARRKLSLYEFSWRNRHLDVDLVAARNRDVLLHC